LLEKLNNRPFQRLEGCRRSAFETIDRPAMRSLPPTRWEFARWKKARVNIDYHVSYDDRLYSVPHNLVGAMTDLRVTASIIEILVRGNRVASHVRLWTPKGSASTLPEHRPKSHREYGAWPPSRIINWGAAIGPSVGALVDHILGSRENPETGYRSCMALIRSAKPYDPARFDAACRRALDIGSPTRRSVLAILSTGLDAVPLLDAPEPPPGVTHDNVRGGAYYDRKETETP
jgi:hypothetical protein